MLTYKSTLLLLVIFLHTGFKDYAQHSGEMPALVPAPAEVRPLAGTFVFSSATLIKADHPSDKAVAFLKDYLAHKQVNSTRKTSGQQVKRSNSVNTLLVTEKGAENLPPEGYRLNISPAQITLTGKGAGLFYGVQSLIQLLSQNSTEPIALPCMEIRDWPRFAYRGIMLDVSRHFFTVQQVKDFLDLMAFYKLNRFHWHLTDDQGWRIEIKSFPQLTQKGAWRVPRVGDFGTFAPPQPGEAATDGGYYTQEQVREIVRYAAARYIQVLPEIDVPGHSMAAVASYPELSCTGDTSIKVNPGSSFAKWFGNGKFEMYVDNTLNPADERVYQFLDKVIGEVANLFPYQYIHLGGDECYKGYWEKDSSVQAFMRKNNLKSSADLQHYFVQRVCRIIRQKNKIPVGWDEIGEGGLEENTVLMSRWTDHGKHAVAGKHPVILTPGTEGLYFDYAQSKSPWEPRNHGGYSPLWKTYSFEPAGGVAEQDSPLILGVQACVWTEHIPNVSKLQYSVLPRMLALSEVAWTPARNKDPESFLQQRIPVHLALLDQAGYNYRVPTAFDQIDTVLTGERFQFRLQPTVAGGKIYYTYTKNGRIPADTDMEWDNHQVLIVPENSKMELQTMVISPAGRRSVPTCTVLYNPGNSAAGIPQQKKDK